MGAASQELTERAKLLIAERRYQEAVRACRRALLVRPDQVEVRLLLGEALLALERYDEVRVEMMALARKRPDHAPVHRLLGEAYLRDGRPTQAVEALQKALKLDPSDEVAQELLGEAADENAPVSTTIERWFADEAEPTVETRAPDWEEANTPVPATAAQLPHEPEPSVQVDPSLVEEAVRPKTSPARPAPRVRARKATTLGHPAALPPPPAAPPPEPPSPSPLPQKPTAVARPQPREDDAPTGLVREPVTEELPLDSADEVPLALEGEPTRAQVPSAKGLTPKPFPPPPEPSFDPIGPLDAIAPLDMEIEDDFGPLDGDLDAVQTSAFTSPLDSPLEDMTDALDEEPTRARPIDDAEIEPPTMARVPMPEARPAPIPTGGSVHAPTPFPSASVPPAYEAAPHPMPAAAPPAEPPRGLGRDIATERVPERKPGKRWLIPAALGALLLAVLGVGGGLAASAWLDASAREEVRASAATAGDSGDRGALEGVVAEIGDDGDPRQQALRARLLATLVLEHGVERQEQARAILASLEGEGPLTDAAIASALLSVSEGAPADALSVLSGLTAEGEQIPEAFRARAYATAALGRWSQAEEAARQAASTRPGAPRHVALHALMLHRTGDSQRALTLLDSVPSGEAHPSVRVVRARVLQDSGSDPARAVEEATALVETLAERATPPEIAWAHLVRARHAAAQGDASTALESARAAARRAPPGDEAFAMGLIETFLRAGSATEAREHLTALPEPPIDASGRALLTAEVLLEAGALDEAFSALDGAEQTPRRSLLRARILEARGQTDEARPLYEAALAVPGPEGRHARIRLASIELDAGRATRAIELLEPLRGEAAADLETAPLLARAYLLEDRLDDASEILDAAIRRRPEAAELLAARGSLQLRRGQVQEALISLRRAASSRENDPDLAVDLGDAARQAGEATEAQQAYERALTLRPAHPRALVGLAHLALAARDIEAAAGRIEEAAATGREALEVARLQGRLMVFRGDGASSASTLEPLARTHRDAELYVALGALHAQAEADREASRAFAQALQRDRDNPEALLGQSLIDVRRGDLSGARRAIATAEREARERGLSEALAPALAVARGRLEFENGDFDETVEAANEAIAADERFGPAHLLLANVAIERGDDGIEHLRAAVGGVMPPPEALGRLAPRLGRGDEACQLARRYLEAAPGGYDAPDVRRVAARCR
ncbi:MAG: tetratricopeptide repeat protein [Myxococcota bacterium]|nr:tetratricopeptide repeat protein [Myxococcota bacterium]